MNKRRNVFALGLAMAIGGAGSVFLQDDSVVADGAPLLAILSPPGAGYDSTNGLLYTARGGAVTVTRAGTLSCNGGTVDANMPCVEGGSLRIPTGQTTTTELSPAPAAAPWCVSARLVRAAGDAAWNAGSVNRGIWANDVSGAGSVGVAIGTAGTLIVDVADASGGLKTWSTAAGTLTTGPATVRVCYDGTAPVIQVDRAVIASTASGAGTGVLPGLNTTHHIGNTTSLVRQLDASMHGFCFHPSLTACQ